MQAKIFFGGEGSKIPWVDFGLSVALFKLWLRPSGGAFRGYTTASNQGLLGAAIIETPIVDFVMRDLEDEEPFSNLHGATVDVTMSPTVFVRNGGIVKVKMSLLTNDAMGAKELSFVSDDCKGICATVGDIRFTATLLQLPDEERDPSGSNLLPI